MQQQFPDNGNSETAEEGNAVHWMCVEVLAGRGAGEWIGRTAPNGVVINADMKAAGIEYVAAVRGAVPDHAQLHIEESISIPYIHPECHGTPDCWFFNPITMTMHIWDLKYGFTVVEAFENWQLLAYATGLFPGPPVDFNKVRVILTIVQPRAYHPLGAVRSWQIMGSELKPYADRLRDAALAALTPGALTVAGTQCHYCRARHACEAAQRYSMWAADYAGQSTPQHLTPEGMAIELRILQRAADAIKNRLTGLESAAIAMGGIPGWAVDQGRGNLTWTKPAQEVFALGDLMGIDVRADQKPITPTQAIKLGLDATVVGMYADRSAGAPKLVPCESTMAARVFGAAGGV